MPFQANAPFETITGQMERQSNRLIISFAIPSPTVITWPNIAAIPERKSGLWTSTCFECFIGTPDRDAYYECNISPAGHWQVFRFDTYRQPPLTESDLISINHTNHENGGHGGQNIACHFSVDVNDPLFVTEQWKISPACVIKDASGLHYYADHHPDDQPDFHLASQRQYLMP